MTKKFNLYCSKITDFHQNILEGLDYTNWKDRVKSDSTIFIKSYITYLFYIQEIKTSPIVHKNFFSILKDQASRIIIGKSDEGNHSFTSDLSTGLKSRMLQGVFDEDFTCH
ncbi:MAG: hypothetical protein ABFD07_03600 [Methanobacterium sp.]